MAVCVTNSCVSILIDLVNWENCEYDRVSPSQSVYLINVRIYMYILLVKRTILCRMGNKFALHANKRLLRGDTQ